MGRKKRKRGSLGPTVLHSAPLHHAIPIAGHLAHVELFNNANTEIKVENEVLSGDEPTTTDLETHTDEEAAEWESLALSPSCRKYWAQRYRLFSRYSEGIVLDQEGWFSVTPELIAAQIARRIWTSVCGSRRRSKTSHKKKKRSESSRELSTAPGLLLDAFCGPGGNAIQFALTAPPGGIVFAVDIDPKKIQMAKHNATVYGAQHRIEFVIGNSLRIAPGFRVDAVYLAPPWGGPGYIESESYDISLLQPESGEALFTKFAAVSPNLAFTLPKTVNQAQLISLAPFGSKMEVEGHYIGQSLKMVTAYYGKLVRKPRDVIQACSPSDVYELPWRVDKEVEEEEEN